MFIKNIPNIYNNEGINIINANNIGNNTVQQNDINWSKRILGKDALVQIKTKISIDVLNAKLKLDMVPLIKKLKLDKVSYSQQ